MAVLGLSASAQDEAPRQLWDSQFLKKRGEGKAAATGAKKNASYKKTSSRKESPSEDKTVGEVIGITIWRLRAVRESDNKEARLLLQEESGTSAVEYTPERVESQTLFRAGERVRLGIESPRDGFLYVVNREQYSDGTVSDPYLIFPTLRNRGGDNSVKAGKLIELPARAAFRLTPMRTDYEGEQLIVIVAPARLSAITAGPGMLKLEKTLVEGWERQWQAPFDRFELNGGAGAPYTKGEKEAGEDGTRLLTQEDELPQTLYRVLAQPANPLLITVSLKIAK